MKLVTLILCLKGEQVLLAMKKRGFGAGKWNGYGGKVEEGETIIDAALRELKEESSLTAQENDLVPVGLVRFHFAGRPKFECHVFLLQKWHGAPQETEEMRPQWFERDRLPTDEMWAADKKWLPLILAGQKIDADVYFDSTGDQVLDFKYKVKR